MASPESRPVRPVGIKAPHGARALEIAWSDGRKSSIPHAILRGYCPCAGCQGHTGTIKFVPGGNLELRNLSQVGNYALSLEWGDLHGSGIYAFAFLDSLARLYEQHGDRLPEALPELPRI